MSAISVVALAVAAIAVLMAFRMHVQLQAYRRAATADSPEETHAGTVPESAGIGSESSVRMYDVALSFAREDQAYVEQVAQVLRSRGLRVFYDGFEEADILGRNLVNHLTNVYRSKTRLCVVFISAVYAQKWFPAFELGVIEQAARESAMTYVIPVRLDDTELPGSIAAFAYVRNKTPEALAELVASKLLRNESSGILSEGKADGCEAIVVRYASLLEPDMETFRTTLTKFADWSESTIASAPIDLRMPGPVAEAVRLARTFRETRAWHSDRISGEARDRFSRFYDILVPERAQETIHGVSILLQHYHDLPPERRDVAVRTFLAARTVLLCRQILMHQLVGMPDVEWAPMFARVERTWTSGIMLGLSYIASLDGDEPYFWVDAGGHDGTGAMLFPRPFRLDVPATLVIADTYRPLQADAFDRHFAPQFCAIGLEAADFMALWYFAHYPERLQLTIRGEYAVTTSNFTVGVSTHNDRGGDLMLCVRRLAKDLKTSGKLEDPMVRLRAELLFGLRSDRYRDVFREPGD